MKKVIIGDCELYLGDCLERMKEIADGSVDLTVTSPPYDNLRTYGDSLEWGEHIWKPILSELFRITKKGGVVVWVVGDATVKSSETGTSFKQALYAMECGFNLHDTMIYEKAQAFGGSKSAYLHSFEYMFIFSKGAPLVFNAIRDRENKRGGSTESTAKGGIKRNGENQDRHFLEYAVLGKRKNVWRYGVGGSKTGHPAVFPEKLAHDHIISWSNEGDVVLDCFLGSGTTGKMAVLSGRKFIGIEKNPDYFEMACKRIECASFEPQNGKLEL